MAFPGTSVSFLVFVCVCLRKTELSAISAALLRAEFMMVLQEDREGDVRDKGRSHETGQRPKLT